MPAAAAAALVLTATGATVAQSAPLNLDLSASQASQAQAQAADAAEVQADLTQRRQQVSIQTAAYQGRVEEQQRIARDQQRKAAEHAALVAQGKRWILPLRTYTLSSPFGMRWGTLHPGEDFACAVGTPIMAMSLGKVTFAGPSGGYGNKIEITYWDGTVSWYGHLSVIKTKVGDEVMPGDVVGLSGNTGYSTGPHLHLEIHAKDGAPAIDPLPWLRAHGVKY
jgi:murein DD-endopeptidase MepM/ murein hydrolase activator NlpD